MHNNVMMPSHACMLNTMHSVRALFCVLTAPTDGRSIICQQMVSFVFSVDADLVVHRLGQVLVFGKIRAALGIMSTVISGGGSLAPHLDDFFEVLALPVLNGWGLTETSPVLACRRWPATLLTP